MRRVVVFGTTGSGKSWLAERLAARHGLRVIELDRLYWGRDWMPAPLSAMMLAIVQRPSGKPALKRLRYTFQPARPDGWPGRAE